MRLVESFAIIVEGKRKERKAGVYWEIELFSNTLPFEFWILACNAICSIQP